MINLLNINKSFTIFGLEIKFYGLLMALSYVLALVVCIILCRKKHYNENLPYKLLLLVFPLAVIGGRLGYVIGDIIKNGTQWSFIDVLKIWEGGLMVYGGIIFSALGLIVYAFIKNKNIISYFDLIAPCLIIGQSLGRWGCVLEGCCYGIEITNPNWMWFPFALEIGGHYHLATQIFESILCLIGFVIIYRVYTKNKQRGLSTSLYLMIYGAIRIFTESFRADEQCLGTGNFRISRFISIVLFVCGLAYFIVLCVKMHKEKVLAKQKHDEANLFAETAEEIENKVYTKEDFVAVSDNPLLDTTHSVLRKTETSGNKRVEKIKQENRERKEKLEKQKQKQQKKNKNKKRK